MYQLYVWFIPHNYCTPLRKVLSCTSILGFSRKLPLNGNVFQLYLQQLQYVILVQIRYLDGWIDLCMEVVNATGNDGYYWIGSATSYEQTLIQILSQPFNIECLFFSDLISII